MFRKNNQLYAKSLAIAPNNPRVILTFLEWNMGAAKFCGKPTHAYFNEVKRALQFGKEEQIDQEFYPKFIK